MEMERFPLIIPTIPADYSRVLRHLDTYFDLLPVNEIIFIGPADLEPLVKKDKESSNNSSSISFLNENELIPFEQVKQALVNRVAEEGYQLGENSRPGWYYQQFLKMAYSRICEEPYYMSWDSDTLPLRRIEMFDANGSPFFDIKKEYIPGYFKTIKKIFGMEKVLELSFISEHMLFNKGFMKEVIREIEAMTYPGIVFYEKIINAIDIDNMQWGFSEFETYGTWIMNRHPDSYRLRNWKSLRKGNFFISEKDLTSEDIKWLAEDFDAVSFEAYHKYSSELGEAFKNPDYRKRYTANQFYQILLENNLFGEYRDGVIIDGELRLSV